MKYLTKAEDYAANLINKYRNSRRNSRRKSAAHWTLARESWAVPKSTPAVPGRSPFRYVYIYTDPSMKHILCIGPRGRRGGQVGEGAALARAGPCLAHAKDMFHI